MALRDRLRRLDSQVLAGLRQPDEDAETYLRRIAGWGPTALGPALATEVTAALGEYFEGRDRAE